MKLNIFKTEKPNNTKLKQRIKELEKSSPYKTKLKDYLLEEKEAILKELITNLDTDRKVIKYSFTPYKTCNDERVDIFFEERTPVSTIIIVNKAINSILILKRTKVIKKRLITKI